MKRRAAAVFDLPAMSLMPFVEDVGKPLDPSAREPALYAASTLVDAATIRSASVSRPALYVEAQDINAAIWAAVERTQGEMHPAPLARVAELLGDASHLSVLAVLRHVDREAAARVVLEDRLERAVQVAARRSERLVQETGGGARGTRGVRACAGAARTGLGCTQ